MVGLGLTISEPIICSLMHNSQWYFENDLAFILMQKWAFSYKFGFSQTLIPVDG